MSHDHDLRDKWRGRGPKGPDRYQVLRMIGWTFVALAIVDIVKAAFGY